MPAATSEARLTLSFVEAISLRIPRVEVPVVAAAQIDAMTVAASPTGAACTAWSEIAPASAVDEMIRPRFANTPRSRSRARVTRFCAASSGPSRSPARGRSCARRTAALVRRSPRRSDPDRVVEERSDVFPVGLRFGGIELHRSGLLFASAAADFGADNLGREVLRGAMKPTGEDWTFNKLAGLARQRDEDGLCDILGVMAVHDHADRHRIDEINVAADDLGERRLCIAFDVFSQKFTVSPAVHSSIITRRRKTGQEI